ncbi:MAG TPA: DegT/DnrJ/EryC1/StrS family aminotransferase [Terriglobia bacterium]|nr:DegT/DnrJ/EryC1/StrS family aminotransferase [Terriglobia bacterium]
MNLATQTVPAILGGPKAVTLDQKEAMRWPLLTADDEQAVIQVLRDGDLSLHRVTRELEEDYRQYFGVRHALAHCNGTAALLAAFFALGLQPGDEVLVPSATFWASVVPMLWLGAIPVFCESEFERLGIDPSDAARQITSRTRAIVVTHLWGMPAKMTELIALARRHNLKIVEDASHAQGAIWRDRSCGALGDISVFSLQSSKLAPAGEGGMLLTNDETLMERAICLGDIERIRELDTPAYRYAATSFGIKTRMAPLSAAVARVQLRRLEERNALRNDAFGYLSDRLEQLGFETFLPPPHIRRVYFEFVFRCRGALSALTRPQLVEALQAEGCAVSLPRYPLLHQQPLFTEGSFDRIARTQGNKPSYDPSALPRTTQVNNELLRLPGFPRASRQLMSQYAEAFEKVLAHAQPIAAHGSSDGIAF